MEVWNLGNCIEYIGRGVPYEYIISNLLCVYMIKVKYVVCMYRKVIATLKLRTIIRGIVASCDAGPVFSQCVKVQGNSKINKIELKHEHCKKK